MILAHHQDGFAATFYSLGYVLAGVILLVLLIRWGNREFGFLFDRDESPDESVRCGVCGADAWIEHPSANYGPPLGDDPTRWQCGACGTFADAVKR